MWYAVVATIAVVELPATCPACQNVFMKLTPPLTGAEKAYRKKSDAAPRPPGVSVIAPAETTVKVGVPTE